MYRWIWNKLPGGKLLKSIQALVLLGLVLAGLFWFVFPALDQLFIAPPTLND